jgi:hypothetical protein
VKKIKKGPGGKFRRASLPFVSKVRLCTFRCRIMSFASPVPNKKIPKTRAFAQMLCLRETQAGKVCLKKRHVAGGG